MSLNMEPPPPGVYSSLDELQLQANGHANTQGYKLVVVRSKTDVRGNKTWVHLACDRHGTKRNTHGLTEETRKKNRRSRRCECPMNCIANKTLSGLWELSIRNPQHNHGPNEPPKKKKKDLPPPHSSETVNLPLLRTPSSCTADFCLIPIGNSVSVAEEVAEVQRLLKRSGLRHSMHASGTTVQGPWDDVMKIIGQAHSLLHGAGTARIQTDIRIGTRTDKQQNFEDKVRTVRRLLEADVLDDEDADEGESMQQMHPSLGNTGPPPQLNHPAMSNGPHHPMGGHPGMGHPQQGHPGMNQGDHHPGMGGAHYAMNSNMHTLTMPRHMPMV